MNPESLGKNNKITFIRFGKNDLGPLIRQHVKVITSSFFLLEARKREVVVRDGNPTDMKIRGSIPGNVVPLGLVKVDSITYRLYRISDTLLDSL